MLAQPGNLKSRLLWLSVALIAAGCASHSNDTTTVPAWVGIPAHFLAPSSQEAYAWRNRHRPLENESLMVSPNPVLQEVGPEEVIHSFDNSEP